MDCDEPGPVNKSVFPFTSAHKEERDTGARHLLLEHMGLEVHDIKSCEPAASSCPEIWLDEHGYIAIIGSNSLDLISLLGFYVGCSRSILRAVSANRLKC